MHYSLSQKSWNKPVDAELHTGFLLLQVEVEQRLMTPTEEYRRMLLRAPEIRRELTWTRRRNHFVCPSYTVVRFTGLLRLYQGSPTTCPRAPCFRVTRDKLTVYYIMSFKFFNFPVICRTVVVFPLDPLGARNAKRQS